LQWRYWWIDEAKACFPHIFNSVSIESPSPIFIDRTMEIKEWNDDVNSYLLPSYKGLVQTRMVPSTNTDTYDTHELQLSPPLDPFLDPFFQKMSKIYIRNNSKFSAIQNTPSLDTFKAMCIISLNFF